MYDKKNGRIEEEKVEERREEGRKEGRKEKTNITGGCLERL